MILDSEAIWQDYEDTSSTSTTNHYRPKEYRYKGSKIDHDESASHRYDLRKLAERLDNTEMTDKQDKVVQASSPVSLRRPTSLGA
jgi:hypothetical protein